MLWEVSRIKVNAPIPHQSAGASTLHYNCNHLNCVGAIRTSHPSGVDLRVSHTQYKSLESLSA